MKKNLLLAIAGVGGMLLSSNYASAQEAVGIVEESVITEVPVECKTNYSTSWKDNWFIQLGAGVQIPYVDRLSTSRSHRAEVASDGMRQSPRGDRHTEPTLGPSGRHERLNC